MTAIHIFSNQCDIYKVVKVVHGNQSDNYYSRSDTQPSILLLLLDLYYQTNRSDSRCSWSDTQPSILLLDLYYQTNQSDNHCTRSDTRPSIIPLDLYYQTSSSLPPHAWRRLQNVRVAPLQKSERPVQSSTVEEHSPRFNSWRLWTALLISGWPFPHFHLQITCYIGNEVIFKQAVIPYGVTNCLLQQD